MPLKVVNEITTAYEPCLIALGDNKNIFVGGDDGCIQAFDETLSSTAKWQAHAVQLFALAAGNGQVYSSSNDGGIRVWSPNGDKVSEYELVGGDVGTLKLHDNRLYAGDETGNVAIYSQNSLKAMYNMFEEVKDICINPPLLFTVRDLDVTVTEINPDEASSRFATRHIMEGRAPICITEKYLFVMTRDGFTLRMHENSMETKFRLQHEIKVSDMIVTCINVSPDGSTVWICGWDKRVKQYSVDSGRLQLSGEIDLGGCVNGIVITNPNEAFAVVSSGKVVKIQASTV